MVAPLGMVIEAVGIKLSASLQTRINTVASGQGRASIFTNQQTDERRPKP
jgi:hypothetical protein